MWLLGFPVVVKTRNGKPVAVLRGLDDDSHVKTRIAQYEALKNGKGIEIAKTVVYSKIESQNVVLRKYGLEQHDLMTVKARIENIEPNNLKDVRRRLLPVEGKLQSFTLSRFSNCFPRT